MATASTSIEWTDRTWNPTSGCTKISAGCDNCYAETIAERFRGTAAFPNGFDVQVKADRVNDPLKWRQPARIFVNSMSDLFHSEIDQAWIADIFAVMAAARRHTFQVLSKRHARMRTLLNDDNFISQVRSRAIGKGLPADQWQWPIRNLWLGVSVENQQWADIRIPALLGTPAAVRFLSCEPLLGPIDLGIGDPHRDHDSDDVHGAPHPRVCLTCSDEEGQDEVAYFRREPGDSGIDWVIVGGESGRKARPMHPDWPRSLRDQCADAGVPFFYKQWGEWAPSGALVIRNRTEPGSVLVGDPVDEWGHRIELRRVGKKKAGRELDGAEHNAFPAVIS